MRALTFLASEGELLQHEGTALTSPVPEASTSAPRDWPSSDAVEASGDGLHIIFQNLLTKGGVNEDQLA